jgi:hypothetical protein
VHALVVTGLVTVPDTRKTPDVKPEEGYLNNENSVNGTPDQWHVEGLAWFIGASGGDALSGDFVGGTVYRAKLTLAAEKGYTFNKLPANSFTSGDGTVSHDEGSGQTLDITITFPATNIDMGGGFGA